MTIEQALIVAVSSLVAAVVAQHAWFRMQFTKVCEKLNDCEEDRERLWEKVAELSGLVGVTKAFSLGPRKSE